MKIFLKSKYYKCCIKMYIRIDISKGIDLVKSNKSKECMICHNWFFNHGFKFQYYDLKMLSVNISDIAVITIKNVDY